MFIASCMLLFWWSIGKDLHASIGKDLHASVLVFSESFGMYIHERWQWKYYVETSRF